MGGETIVERVKDYPSLDNHVILLGIDLGFEFSGIS